jgi:transcriptional regulator with XRE-family HTH domain
MPILCTEIAQDATKNIITNINLQQAGTPTKKIIGIFAGRGQRDEIAEKLKKYEEIAQRPLSQRQIAGEIGVPRSTLQRWLKNKENIQSDPEVISFLESPAGLKFLHQIVVSAEFTFSEVGCGSVRLMQTFIEKGGLAPFVAHSYGHERDRLEKMQNLIGEFGDEERERLVPLMPPKDINVVEDETFHPEICLVGMEPVSNFIFIEEYAESRDGKTWTSTMKPGMKDLKVTVIQAGGDGASGLLKHAKEGLCAHHAPDIFHVLYDISKGMGAPLAAKIRKAAVLQKEAKQTVEAWTKNKDEYQKNCLNDSNNFLLGYSEELEAVIAEVKNEEKEAQEALIQAERHKEEYRSAIRAISNAYHPCDLETGLIKNPEIFKKDANKAYEVIEEIAAEAGLSDASFKLIKKSKKMIKGLVATLAFFFVYIRSYIKSCDLSNEHEQLVFERLMPTLYIGIAGKKARKSEQRKKLLERSKQLLDEIYETPGWMGLRECEKAKFTDCAKHCAQMFLRSTSCVEGRNGQLSLRHHNFHALGKRKIKALTVIHNFYIKRKDGTSAAERFFCNKPNDLFNYLIENMPLPARPKQYPKFRAMAVAA